MGKQVFKSRTRLMKMLYLLSREKKELVQKITRDEYEFEWYLFGPFSKEVFFDLEELEREGFIEIIPVNMEKYTMYEYVLTKKGKDYLNKLISSIPKEYIEELFSFLEPFEKMSASEIKKYVYQKYS